MIYATCVIEVVVHPEERYGYRMTLPCELFVQGVLVQPKSFPDTTLYLIALYGSLEVAF